MDISYTEVLLRDENSIKDFKYFYSNIYIDCFPDEDERESMENMLLYLKNAETSENHNYHIILAIDSKVGIIGGGVFAYVKTVNAGFIEYIAVNQNTQSGGVGTHIYNHILEILSEDARKTGNTQVKYIFCEIDSPEHSKAAIKKYLHFWQKYGYLRLDFKYLQPALSQSQSPVTGLWLVVLQFSGIHNEIEGNVVLNVLSDYMKYAMLISDPERNPEYVAMSNELRDRTIQLLDII